MGKQSKDSTVISNTENKALLEISVLAKRTIDQQALVNSITDQLNEATTKLRELETELLPEAMYSANVERFTTTDGIEIKLKSDLTISMNSGDKSSAINWLRTHGHEGVIKNQVVVTFMKGQDKQAKQLLKELKASGLDAESVTDVNSSSVKAILRGELEKGTVVPLEMFGTFEFTKAVVKIKN